MLFCWQNSSRNAEVCCGSPISKGRFRLMMSMAWAWQSCHHWSEKTSKMRAWEWFFWHLHGMRKPSIIHALQKTIPFCSKKNSLIFIQVISSSHLSSVQCHPSMHWWPSSRLLPHQNRRWCQCSRCNQNGWRALCHPVPGLESSRRVSAAPHLGFLAAPTKRVDFSWEKWGDFQMTWDKNSKGRRTQQTRCG